MTRSPSSSPSPSPSPSSSRARLLIGLIPLVLLIISLTTIYYLTQRLLHNLDDSSISISSLRFPRSLDDVKIWSRLLSQVGERHQHHIHVTEATSTDTDTDTDASSLHSTESNPTSTSTSIFTAFPLVMLSSRDRDILILFIFAYIVKQAFAIPGSSVLNVLAGSMWGLLGWPLVTLLTAIGASCCYALSYACGGASVARYLFTPQRLNHMRSLVAQQSARRSLFWFCLSLRLLPATPNFFLNFASPLIGVPFWTFFFSVLIGLAPYCFICVRSGLFLSQLSSMDSLMDAQTVLSMVAVSGIALIPVAISYYYHKDTLKQINATKSCTETSGDNQQEQQEQQEQQQEQEQEQEQEEQQQQESNWKQLRSRTILTS